jgi:hypothetical protein
MAEVVQFDRMYPLRYHPEQSRLWGSLARFNVVPAGRRSGKTEIVGKRKLVLHALRGTQHPNPRFFAAAPTRDQAKRIYWKDLKIMAKQTGAVLDISESSLVITFVHGPEIHVLGMDKPERIEGTPWDGGVLDEYGNMKKETWGEHVRPALSDRLGWCDFIGVPEGRNHYYNLYKQAQAEKQLAIKNNYPRPIWDTFWWKSADILPAEEIELAQRDLDELTYQQEYEGSFVNFTGRAYHSFDEKKHVQPLVYNPQRPLVFAFDFNVSPGVAAIAQEQKLKTGLQGTGWINEVWIPRHSNTIRVCDKLIQMYPKHQGWIICYGDATGGAKGTAKVLGSDWQLIKQKLWTHYGKERVFFKVPKSNPRERDRINSVNSRLLAYDGSIKMAVAPSCVHLIQDFEGVVTIEGGTGEIDKKSDETLTHLTDAVGYFTWREYPLKKQYQQGPQIPWK